MVEIYYTLIGRSMFGITIAKRIGFAKGTISNVEFDWKSIYDREDSHGDVIGFFHTHPGKCVDPSSTDMKTMNAWVSCLGKNLLCIIGDSKCKRFFSAKFCRNSSIVKMRSIFIGNSFIISI